MDRIKHLSTAPWICVLLAIMTLALYSPVLKHKFVNYDDPVYITDNAHVNTGLTWENVRWAFTTGYAGNWHPVTWLSHQLDCQLFGLNGGRHHLVSYLLHAANAVLLFLLLRRLTGTHRRSALVAALWAFHPLRVESVAWVAERKDVLCAFFFMLTLLAYAKYAARMEDTRLRMATGPGSAPPSSILNPLSSIWYFLALGLFALGLMSKPMLVTLPCILLLLDFWPLGRLRLASLNSQPSTAVQGSKLDVRRSMLVLLLEKLPFFALSALFSVVTFFAQRHTGAMMELNAEPLDYRLENAMVSYFVYLRKMFWPTDLAAHYSLPPAFPDTVLVGSAAILMMLSLLAFVSGRQRPWLTVGWLWYLGMLLPVIGLVQVGTQAMADRFTYLPMIGISIAVVWGVAELGSRWPALRIRLAVPAAGTALLGCLVLTASQVRVWHDSETLFRHAIAVTHANARAHLNLGGALAEQDKIPQAAEEFAEALRINPRYCEAHVNYGCTLQLAGRYDEAIAHFRAALALKPQALTYQFLATALLAEGKRDEAVAEMRAALQLDPNLPEVLNDLAWALATAPEPDERDGVTAVVLAERACRLSQFHDPQMLGTLAAAYAEAGRFEDAVRNAESAHTLAIAAGNHELAAKNESLLKLYRSGNAYHEEK